MSKYSFKKALANALLKSGISLILFQEAFASDGEFKVICPNPLPPTPKDFPRSEVYSSVPYKPGEITTYQASWMGMHAGSATIEVQSPQKHNGMWHRVFHVDGKTGDWFKGIFVAHDESTAFVRPWDAGVSKFYIEQNEGTLLGKPFIQKKWLDFNHDACKVTEKVWMPGKEDDIKDREVQYGAIDAIGSVFKMRTFDYVLNKPEKFLVYTSEKNWFLEANPVAIEDVTVPAGTFKSVKLRLQTYIGKALQQKGEVYVWIAKSAPFQLVQVQGEIKIGSVFLRMSHYQEGQK
ncbi:MAG: DUF3108 domain-containing protein [Proteobacteria bacterium]|nr:DUF3108 domain-containing protein [Pseudomonadota bacterium]